MPVQDEVLEAARYLDTATPRQEFALVDIVSQAVRAGSKRSEASLRAAVVASPHVWRIDHIRYRLSISGRSS